VKIIKPQKTWREVKKRLKNKNLFNNQKSFYFEDYLESNLRLKKSKNKFVSEDRVYILFFFFLALISFFFLKITILAFQESKFENLKNASTGFKTLRRDIVDRNGELLSRNIHSYHAAIRSKDIKDSKKFLLKLKINFPEIDIEEIKKNINTKKYFYFKKRLTKAEKDKLWSLGEKAIIFEPFQTRIYPQANLFSHTLGQIDSENYGVSGIENYFDKELKDQKKIKIPLSLSLDANIQFIIKSELEKSLQIFKSKGGGSLLIDSSNGEILSMVSLPDFDINSRKNITDKNYLNKITKGVYELGSIFKTFTIALAFEENLLEPETVIENIPKEIRCSKYKIKDIKDFPKNLSVEDILIRSSNIGTVKIAQQIGEEKMRDFFNKLNILNTSEIELNEVGTPIPFNWQKCKLETVSYGHGITTTLIQVGSAYASLINGGYTIKPTLIKKDKMIFEKKKRIVSEHTSQKIQKILRKVVTDENGTASLADIFGYQVSGKTGTAQYYNDKSKNINTFISSFKVDDNKKYVLLVMLDNPQVAKDLMYNYRGIKIKGTRNEAGWNSAYLAGKIIEKIGPILAINSEEFNNNVVKKFN